MPDVYFPGSSVPFRPVNPHGRPMPKPTRQEREPLYQLIVTRAGRGQIPFGPKMTKDVAQAWHDTIDGAIRSGVEKELSDPHIVKCV